MFAWEFLRQKGTYITAKKWNIKKTFDFFIVKNESDCLVVSDIRIEIIFLFFSISQTEIWYRYGHMKLIMKPIELLYKKILSFYFWKFDHWSSFAKWRGFITCYLTDKKNLCENKLEVKKNFRCQVMSVVYSMV